MSTEAFMKVHSKRIRPFRVIVIVATTLFIFLLLKRSYNSDKVGEQEITQYFDDTVSPSQVEKVKNGNGNVKLDGDVNADAKVDGISKDNDKVEQIYVDNKPLKVHVDNAIKPLKNSAEKLDIDFEKEMLEILHSQDDECPDYLDYSRQRHPPFSEGEFKYPFMRPSKECRTFSSNIVESLIKDLQKKVESPDLARLIENCLPNTLDTTILWHKTAEDHVSNQAQTFIVTGDIHAEWLRDSARQLSIYQPLVKYDPALKEMIKGAINTQARFVVNSPYCNAFHPPPESGVKRGQAAEDQVYPKPDWDQVFECKYEIDSLASFLTLSNEYFEHSGDDSFLTETWWNAYEKLLVVFRRESQPSFDKETGYQSPFYYSFQRHTNIGSETLPLGGVGNPVNYGTGLVRSAFRPSDDSCILQFFVPGNIHALTELKKTKQNFLTKKNQELFNLKLITEVTDNFIKDISSGIEKYGIVNHPVYGKVYAYEIDGYGGATFMDDANIPSLLSIPDLGFTSKEDSTYQNTRKMIMQKSGNPYYLKGKYFEGIGGPHIGLSYAWPMSLLVAIRTTDDDKEIVQHLKLIMETTGDMGLMHEGVNVHSQAGYDYTRSWFAWCNSEFGKTILHLAKHKPHLIFKKEYASKGYDLDAVLQSFAQN